MRQLVGLLDNKIVGPTASISASTPSGASAGIDVTSWRGGKMAPIQFQLFIDGAASGSIASPALWGYIATRSSWYFVQSLNGGTTIPIVSATQGHAETLNLALGNYDRLAVVGTPTGGPFTASAGPLESWSF